MKPRLLSLFVPAILLTLAACSAGETDGGSYEVGDGPAPGTGRIKIEVTDAPLDLDLIEVALLKIDRVEIHRSDDVDTVEDEGEWISLYEGVPFGILLSNLRNGLTQGLVDVELDAGSYDQLRLRVPDGELELINGNVYVPADGSLHLASLDTSGLKLHFSPQLEVLDGLSSEILLDFDLSKMFKPVPGNDPLAATKFNVHPSVKVSNLSETGEVRGKVIESDGLGGTMGSDTASVYLMPPGETDLDLAITSTATETDGHFAFLGVDPGTYDLIAVRDLLGGSLLDVPVVAGAVSEVEILIE